MYIPFDQLKDDSKIWIFQANRKLEANEEKVVEDVLKGFSSKWAAHGKQLASSFAIVNHLHIIVGVDLSVHQASGCSIDSLTHQIKELGKQFDIDFFDRRAVAYKNNNQVDLKSYEEVKASAANGNFTSDTLIYNNLLSTKGDLEHNWLIAASQSWLKTIFKNKNVTTL